MQKIGIKESQNLVTVSIAGSVTLTVTWLIVID